MQGLLCCHPPGRVLSVVTAPLKAHRAALARSEDGLLCELEGIRAAGHDRGLDHLDHVRVRNQLQEPVEPCAAIKGTTQESSNLHPATLLGIEGLRSGSGSRIGYQAWHPRNCAAQARLTIR